MLYKSAKRQDRRRRIKARMTSDKLRLVVFRSTIHTYAQIIDDTTGKTLVAASDLKAKKGTKTERAREVGKELAAKALEKKLSVVVFDRAGYQYHGRVKALADSAREGGLQF